MRCREQQQQQQKHRNKDESELAWLDNEDERRHIVAGRQ